MIDVFKARGWEVIISDNLVNRLLGVICLCVGIVTGGITLLVAFIAEEVEHQSGWLAAGFFFGFISGILFSSILMGLLSSVVDCIIVLYAEAPEELALNHPEVAEEMGQAWKAVWPQISGRSVSSGIV